LKGKVVKDYYLQYCTAGLSWKLVAIIILGRKNKKRLSFVFFFFLKGEYL